MEKIKIKDVDDVILQREASKICNDVIWLIHRDVQEI